MEKVYDKKMIPDHNNDIYLWEAYSEQLLNEYRQSYDEGLDVERFKGLIKEIAALPPGEIKEGMSDLIFKLVTKEPLREGYKYIEPSDYGDIVLHKNGNANKFPRPDKDTMREKAEGAWYGRIAGCLLGKPVEGMRRHELIPFLKESGNYPMHRYISKNDITPEMKDKYSFNLEGKCYADAIECAPDDDDTNYTVIGGELIEKYGRDFTPYDVSRIWTSLQTKEAYFTAERVAYKNFINGYLPPVSAIYKNVFREWIGAQIRADYFGYINPGDPEKAAEMAWRDASISHVKNGIYGEMFAAAMVAAAAGTDNITEIIRAGINEIPSGSRLYEKVDNIIKDFENGVPEEDTFKKICEEWDDTDGYDWCHTIPNAEIVTAALLYGNGDYSKSVCLAVQTGFDTDCNGATVGSVLGMAKGISAIGKEWTDPIRGTLKTGLFGKEKFSVDTLIERTMVHAGY